MKLLILDCGFLRARRGKSAVCLGNICRSPTAEGVFVKLLSANRMNDRISVDSAGNGAWHPGKAPDQRARAVADERGHDLSRLRARQVESADFDGLDHILAMDDNNYKELLRMAPVQHHSKIRLFLDYAPQFALKAVPDPCFKGLDCFNI